MTNPSKQRGTAFETAIVAYLRDHGYPHAERRALHGTLDRGDVAGVPGVVIEAKATKAIDLAAAVDEAEAERVNAGARLGIAVVKRRMRSVGDAYAVVPLRVMVELLCALEAATFGEATVVEQETP